MATGMFLVFDFDKHALLYLSDNLYFDTPYIAKRFDICPEILLEPFLVTLMGDSVLAKRV